MTICQALSETRVACRPRFVVVSAQRGITVTLAPRRRPCLSAVALPGTARPERLRTACDATDVYVFDCVTRNTMDTAFPAGTALLGQLRRLQCCRAGTAHLKTRTARSLGSVSINARQAGTAWVVTGAYAPAASTARRLVKRRAMCVLLVSGRCTRAVIFTPSSRFCVTVVTLHSLGRGSDQAMCVPTAPAFLAW